MDGLSVPHMMVTMEDCEDQATNDEPIMEQADIQPNTYTTAMFRTNSHNLPIRTEDFIWDLNLSTPDSLKGTFKLRTPAQGCDCFFASLVQQPPFLQNTTAAQPRMSLRDFILEAGVKTVYKDAFFPMRFVTQDVGRITIRDADHL